MPAARAAPVSAGSMPSGGDRLWVTGSWDAEEHQADADARREQHGQPGRIAVLRRRVLAAEADPAQRRKRHAEAKQDEEIRGGEEEPVEGLGRPDSQIGENRRRLLRKQQGAGDERDHEQRRDDEDGVVDVEIEDADVVFADFVAAVGNLDLRRSGIRLRLADFIHCSGPML